MKETLILLMTACSLQCMAQQSVDTAMMRRIREEEERHSQVRMLAHYLTDVAGPRLTNSPAQLKAGKWAADKMKEWGLVNTGLEPWGDFGKGWQSERFYLAMTQPYYQPLLAFPYPWTDGTYGEKTAGVMLLDSIGAASQHGEELKGKIVMVKRVDTFMTSIFKALGSRYDDTTLEKITGEKSIDYSSFKTRIEKRKKAQEEMYALKKKGVIAILMSTDGNRDGAVYQIGVGAYKKGTPPSLPIVSVAREDYLRLQRLIESGQNVTVNLDAKASFYNDDLKGYNVIAEIPGTDKNLKSELVMLGGHLDSWCNATGATDNAAGCIATMEAVRILQALHIKPRRTIRIALWSGEEEGIFGSHYYVKNHFGDVATMALKPDQEKISAYYNLDNGSGKIRGIFLQNDTAAGPLFQKWLQPFADMGATKVAVGNTGSTDHVSFDEVGIPGFQFIQDPLDYGGHTHHSNMDNYDHLFLEDLKQASVIIAAFVYNTAMNDAKVPRKALPAPHEFPFE